MILVGLQNYFISPDVIIDELLDPDGGGLMRMGLERGELSEERVLEVEKLSGYPEILL